jgi:membrane-associated phospholipid phosphatase
MLPKGWADLVRQLVLFCGAYWLYRVVRGQVSGRAVDAFENARHIAAAERSLGVFPEPGVHRWAEAHGWIADGASWMYVNSHFAITTAALAYLYLRRNEHYYFVRNMFMIAMGIALVGYLAYPTAPPRLLPELGFRDSVAELTGVDAQTSNLLVNPYAAVPSMHVAFALMLAVPMARMSRRAAVRVLWGVYPALVTFTVVATANHWWLDAALGGATAALSAIAAQALLARARPDAWAWDPGPRAARA